MSFVEQEDIFNVVEKLMINLFKNFSKKKINEIFPRIPYQNSLDKYGTDKPDLRNPLIIQNITEIFKREDVKFDLFKKLIKTGSVVRAIVTKNTKDKPRSFFDSIDKWAKKKEHQVWPTLLLNKNKQIMGRGPLENFLAKHH